jgi:hypothetical protein
MVYAPTWTLMLSFERGEHLATNALFFDQGPLRWAAEESSKPGRNGHNWVLHATPEWSREHCDAAPEKVARELEASFCAVTGYDPADIGYRAAHRWRYAEAINPLTVGAFWDRELRLGVCGDWCQGARIEGAYLSGEKVAGLLLQDLADAAAGEIDTENDGCKGEP